MGSFSDFELSIVAVLLSIFAVYLHIPLKEIQIPAWLRQLGKNGGSSTLGGAGVSKDFVELMRESVNLSQYFTLAPFPSLHVFYAEGICD